MSRVIREQLKVAAERCVLVHVTLPGRFVDPRDPFSEIRALAETAGATVAGSLAQRRAKPNGRTYLGKGKTEELAAMVKALDATLVVFDNDLSPAQIRSIEKVVEVKIIDRSELILDIFARRAATPMAKLQVEIAQLEYTYPRLRAMWDHLGQVVGGAPIGIGTRGPGEQQLEIDRRLAQRRLTQLRGELARIQDRKVREVQQRNLEHFTVGLVGYTNAGKSTLFNRLTAGGAFAHDKLFATLSTRIETWDLGGGEPVLLSDTVGFIRDLPHHLVASFRSTLEETIDAGLLVVLVDVSDPNAEMQLGTVLATLDEIGATTQPRIIALNKTDRLERPADLLVWLNRHPEAIAVSAVAGTGLEELTERVREIALGGTRRAVLSIPMREGRAISFVESRTRVDDRRFLDDEIEYDVRIGRRQVEALLAGGARFRIDGIEPIDALRRLWDAGPGWGDGARRPPHETLHPEA